MSVVLELSEKPTCVVPSVSEYAPVKFVPVSVTVVPAGPLVGLSPVMVGAPEDGGGGGGGGGGGEDEPVVTTK